MSQSAGYLRVTKEDDEIAELARGQRRANRQRVDPQQLRIGGHRFTTLSLEAFAYEGEEIAYREPGFDRVDNEVSDQPEPMSHNEAQLAVVRQTVAGLSAFERRVYELAFGGQMSTREIAAELDDAVSYRTVQRALTHVTEQVAAALAAAGEDASKEDS